jgi:hypothetical protein
VKKAKVSYARLPALREPSAYVYSYRQLCCGSQVKRGGGGTSQQRGEMQGRGR